jgi:RNA polymerase sigma factor (sigma-70 family)
VNVDASNEGPTTDPTRGMSPEVARVLVDNHRRFLAFLEKRVGRRELAEEILQEAFVRGLAQADSLRDIDSATAWFYRVLRNALTDHFRRQGARSRALEAAKHELSEVVDEEVMNEVCTCVGALIDTLKPEYAEAVRRVELGGASVQEYAAAAGITANNAGVRLHRAREALRKQLTRSCGTCALHGCVDCTCKHGGCS